MRTEKLVGTDLQSARSCAGMPPSHDVRVTVDAAAG
jgi:hypothetical protein